MIIINVDASPAEQLGPMSVANENKKKILYDDFSGSALDPAYDIRHGPGMVKIVRYPEGGNFLRYYALTNAVEFAGSSEKIVIDSLGRPYVPSLTIARPFPGESWTFDTLIIYGFKQPSNGRAIKLWIIWGDIADRRQNAIIFERNNDNPGRPEERGSLTLNLLEAGMGLKEPVKIQLTDDDLYFFRISRRGNQVEVMVSTDGHNYSSLLQHSFNPDFSAQMQWIMINGTAFARGAYADIKFFSVTGPESPIPPVSRTTPEILRIHGKPDKYETVQAEDLHRAMLDGKTLEVRYARIKGDVYFIGSGNMIFTNCIFDDNVIGARPIYEGDLVLEACDFQKRVNFSTSQFQKKASFYGSRFYQDTRFILSSFQQGASFSGAIFKHKVWFRLADFAQPTSFYYADFEGGADFSSTTFGEVVSFSDFSFSPPEVPGGAKPSITFFKSEFKDKAEFILTLQRGATTLGEELSFQQAKIKHLIVSAGDPNPWQLVEEQTGPGLWTINSNVSLMNAQIHTLIFKNISIKGATDLRGVAYVGGADSVQFLNADFSDLKLDAWPVGKVLAPTETRNRLVNVFEAANNKIASRTAYFDLLLTSDYYSKWLDIQKEKITKKDPQLSHEKYLKYMDYHRRYNPWNLFLKPFWFISGYATSLPRTFCFGGVLLFGFAIAFFFIDFHGSHFVRIEKPLEFKTRLSETPVLSFGETPIAEAKQISPKPATWWEKLLRAAHPFWQRAKVAFLFSLNTVTKVGFGNVRVRLNNDSPERLRRLAWVAWGVGYLWYGLLLYTFVANPVLKGIF